MPEQLASELRGHGVVGQEALEALLLDRLWAHPADWIPELML